MNETKSPEIQLHSWQPRRPSANLKQTIFRARNADTGWWRFEITWTFRWLAPAAACLLLVMSVAHQQNRSSMYSAELDSALTLNSSNQGCLPYVPGKGDRGHNTFSVVTFEWTNRNSSTSSIGSFLPDKLN